MSSSDLPDDSRENPMLIPETEDADFPNGSQENPAMIIDVDDTDGDDEEAPQQPRTSNLYSLIRAIEYIENQELLGFRNRDEEEEEEERRSEAEAFNVWVREKERERRELERVQRHKQYQYEIAKRFAFDLHSDKNPNKIQSKEDDQEKVAKVKGKGKGKKSLFKEAKKAIEKRKSDDDSISESGEIEFDLLTERKAPTLMEMSARVLAKNSDAIKSLNLVPDHLRKKLSNLVSDLGKVDAQFVNLLIQDSPCEVFVKNCVELEDKDLTQILCDCDTLSLKVLRLGLCGRAITENAITEFLKRSPIGFPSLTSLSLKGAFCLTDNGLALISKSAPLLQFINLKECSILTSDALEILADQFGSTLRGLNIEGCQGIKASNVFKRSLCKFEKLNYLSVAGIESITHCAIIKFFMSHGSNLTGLCLASCNQVTNESITAIGKYCPNLEALDISHLDKLTDKSFQGITDGCRSLNSVTLTKNRFSDEAVAAFLEVCGGSLDQLCLNNVRDVGQCTAISLAKDCKRLRHLDLSWCRKLTEADLRRILSCCPLLRSLKLFGWTQVEDGFLEELSRSQVRITGLKMTSVFAHLDDSYQSVDAKFF